MTPDRIRERTADHLDKMDTAIRAAGITPEEPLAPVLEEWRRSLAWAGELTAEMRDMAEKARVPAEAGTADPAFLDRVMAAAAAGADRRAGELLRAHNRRAILSLAAGLVACALAGGAGGYWVGRHSQVATATELPAAALRDGPDAADNWLRLMQANDGRAVKAACAASTAASDGGRKACVLGLWIEPPTNSGPRTVPGSR